MASGNGLGMVVANDLGDTPALQTRARQGGAIDGMCMNGLQAASRKREPIA